MNLNVGDGARRTRPGAPACRSRPPAPRPQIATLAYCGVVIGNSFDYSGFLPNYIEAPPPSPLPHARRSGPRMPLDVLPTLNRCCQSYPRTPTRPLARPPTFRGRPCAADGGAGRRQVAGFDPSGTCPPPTRGA